MSIIKLKGTKNVGLNIDELSPPPSTISPEMLIAPLTSNDISNRELLINYNDSTPAIVTKTDTNRLVYLPFNDATQNQRGIMSADDKQKVDNCMLMPTYKIEQPVDNVIQPNTYYKFDVDSNIELFGTNTILTSVIEITLLAAVSITLHGTIIGWQNVDLNKVGSLLLITYANGIWIVLQN